MEGQVGANGSPGITAALVVVPIDKPEDVNLILGQAHFIKTVEDLHEALIGSVPGIRFGLAFAEASGPALVRWSGTDDELAQHAAATVREIGAGHVFLILLRNAFPINVLPAVRAVQEVCTVYCATANPVQVILAQTSQGRGVLGVIDGVSPTGIEGEPEIAARKGLLRQFGYKLG